MPGRTGHLTKSEERITMNAEHLLLLGFISALLLALSIPLGMVWLYLRFEVEVKYHKDKQELRISYGRAKVGSVLKPLSSIKRDEVEPI